MKGFLQVGDDGCELLLLFFELLGVKLLALARIETVSVRWKTRNGKGIEKE
jgi:hypothetical protein